MPRILHLIPTLEVGGAERQLALLATEQLRRGHDVHVAARRQGSHARMLHERGIHFHHLSDRRWASPVLFRQIANLIDRVRPDIVQTWLVQMDVLGGVAARLRGVPWVCTERSNGTGLERRSLVNIVRRRVARHAAAIITNSDGGAAYWRRHRSGTQNVHVIRNALELASIRDAAEAGRVPHAQLPAFTFIVVGRLSPEKRVGDAIRALPGLVRTHDARLLVVGNGRELGKLVRLAAQLDVRDRVSFVRAYPGWWELLGSASCLVSTSEFEGHPNVVLEAMAAGCPVILSDISAHHEVVAASGAVFVSVGDIPALTTAMQSVVDDPPAVAARIREAFRGVGDLSVSRTADAYESVYSTAIGRGR